MADEPREGGFEQELERRLRGVRAGRGPCPDSEALADYSMGALSAESAEQVERHLRQCGLCDALVYRLKAAEAEEERVERGWRVRLPGWLLGPVPAYAAALLLLYPAYQWFARERQAPAPREDAGARIRAIAGLNLELVREGNWGTQRAPAGPSFLAHFLVPVKEGFRYTATLRDGAGNALTEATPVASWDGIGNTTLLIRTDVLGAGEYTIEVKEIDAATGQAGRSFAYRFRR